MITTITVAAVVVDAATTEAGVVTAVAMATGAEVAMEVDGHTEEEVEDTVEVMAGGAGMEDTAGADVEDTAVVGADAVVDTMVVVVEEEEAGMAVAARHCNDSVTLQRGPRRPFPLDS